MLRAFMVFSVEFGFLIKYKTEWNIKKKIHILCEKREFLHRETFDIIKNDEK